jgi:LmbE family N-acetylglucosaminyl deacetylase
VCAIYPDARNPFAHPALLAEGFEAWTVSELWIMATSQPSHFVDVTDAVDRKLAALRCHESQHPDVDGMEERVRGWVAITAKAAGYDDGRAAEGFRLIQTG